MRQARRVPCYHIGRQVRLLLYKLEGELGTLLDFEANDSLGGD